MYLSRAYTYKQILEMYFSQFDANNTTEFLIPEQKLQCEDICALADRLIDNGFDGSNLEMTQSKMNLNMTPAEVNFFRDAIRPSYLYWIKIKTGLQYKNDRTPLPQIREAVAREYNLSSSETEEVLDNIIEYRKYESQPSLIF